MEDTRDSVKKQLNFDENDAGPAEQEPEDQNEELPKNEGMNENFFYNSMLARALLHILSYKDRKNIRIWLDKLAEMDSTEEDIALRHEYMWFLLLMLETKKIRDPFNKLPPKDLIALRDAVPRHVYEEVLLWNDQNNFSVEHIEDTKARPISESGPPAKTCAPAKFLENQPWPKKGVICYLAAFSDRDN